MSVEVVRGGWYRWEGLDYIITRLARDGSWADIAVFSNGRKQWTKRQPLPLPEGTVRAKDVTS